jgi:hypothetical protein
MDEPTLFEQLVDALLAGLDRQEKEGNPADPETAKTDEEDLNE